MRRRETAIAGTAGAGGGRRGFGRLFVVLALAVCSLALTAGTASAEIATATAPTITEVTGDSAHLSSTLDPKGGRNYPYFEYSTDQVNWTVGPEGVYTRIVEGDAGPSKVEETLLNLKADTKYYVRLAFQGEPEFIEHYSQGPDPSFTTPHINPPKAVQISAASEVGYFTAKFTGEVERPGDAEAAADVDCRLEYVTDEEFNPRNEVQKLYIYARAGTYTLTFGGQKTKTILFNAPPIVVQEKLEALSSIGPGGVSVSGGVGDLQGQHPYLIEFVGKFTHLDVEPIEDNAEGLVGKEGPGDTYDETSAPGHGEEKFNRASRTPCNPATATTPSAKTPITAELTGLTHNTTYHVRLVAENAGGTDYLEAPNFKTVFAPAPTVTMNPIVNPGPTSVEATATINPNGNRTIAWFEYSSDSGQSWRFAPYGDYGEIPAPVWCEAYGGDDSCSLPIFGNTPQLFVRTINERNINHYFGPDPLLLEPNTSYLVRVHARNPGGDSVSPALPFKTKTIPPVVQTLNGNGGPTEAKLSANINPKNAPVTYQFEWGVKEGDEDETYENLDPVQPEALSLADNAFHLATTTITGLQPHTTYHFRVAATNTQTNDVTRGTDRTFTTSAAEPAQPEGCPNESSRVGRSSHLPDCRAFEFATPGMNQGEIIVQDLGWVHAYGSVAPDGNHVTINPIDAPVKALGSHIVETVVASRGADGWQEVESLAPPNVETTGEYTGPLHAAISVSPDFTESVVITDQPIAGPDSPPGVGLYLHRADGSFIPLTQKNGGAYGYYNVNAVSQDYKHIFFEPAIKQFEDDPYPGYPYGGNAYEWDHGDLKLVGIMPDGTLAPEGAAVPPLMSGKGSMITPDGHSVLFRANGLPYLYVRINAEKTINVAEPQLTTPNPSSPLVAPRAVGITPDGSKVLFSSRTELTDDANTGELEGVPNQFENIYLFDVNTKKLTDLTVDNKPIDERRGAGVVEVLRTSEDFSYIYFVATGDLAPGATSGEQNIYVWHEGKITYIGANPDGAPEQGYRVDATPDGKHFIFLSSTNQTAYDSEGKLMVYKYDYGDAVQCVSCRPSGAPPTRPAASAFNENMISNDGSRVFFVTADKLVPQASNGVQNVYEFENGEPHLMTPGDTEGPIALLGASESGDDVFLVTTEELAKGEGRAWGVYDARVNAQVPPVFPSVGCQGENCRGPRTQPPDYTSSGTQSFEAITRVAASAPKSVRAAAVQIRVIAPGDGTVSISGRGLKSASLQVSRAGSVTMGLALKPKADKRRRRVGAYRTDGEVLFTAGNGDISRADVPLKFEAGATKKKGGK